MPDEYLARLADAYARFFYQYDEAPLLIINSERLNFVDNPAHLELLLARIAGMRGAARVLQPRPGLIGRAHGHHPHRGRARRSALDATPAAWRSCRRWATCTPATSR